MKGCNPEDTAQIGNVYKALSQPAEYDNHGDTYAWEMAMFDHAPIVAASVLTLTPA